MFGGYDSARVARVTRKLQAPRRSSGRQSLRKGFPQPDPDAPPKRYMPPIVPLGKIRGQGYPGRITKIGGATPDALGRWVGPNRNF